MSQQNPWENHDVLACPFLYDMLLNLFQLCMFVCLSLCCVHVCTISCSIQYVCIYCFQFSLVVMVMGPSGWPSFSEVVKKGTVTKVLDETMGMSRIEVVCTKVIGYVSNSCSYVYV